MLHDFKPGTLDPAKCLICKHTEDMHECDICGRAVSVQLKYGNMLMCAACTENEEKLYIESQKPENVAARLQTVNAAPIKAAELNEVIKAAKVTDDSIEVRTDLFNAATVAINEVKAAIDADDSITNKPYALAEFLKGRFEHFREVIFEMNQKAIEAGNEQKAIQVYLNQLANTLRAEEREKLKIADLNYQPKAVKPATPKPIKTTGRRSYGKLNKEELRKTCVELSKRLGVNIPEFMIQTIVVSKGVVVAEAAKILEANIIAARAASEK